MLNINELTIRDINRSLKKKEISIKELVQEYLNRIQLYDQNENGLKSINELNPDILEIAEKLDNGFTEDSGLLYGIPITIKDNINTGDKLHTSAGSIALQGNKGVEDADVIKRLRDKGVLIIGKNNMTEFANYMTKDMPPGYSSIGGQCISPYNIEGDPSGSSTGSGVAVTSNLCMFSIGTDTAGSIISPSIHNSIVGFRPSMGQLSQKGIIPVSYTFDTAGPMARTVNDIIIVYSEMTRSKLILENDDKIDMIKIGYLEEEFHLLNEEEIAMAEEIMEELHSYGFSMTPIAFERIEKDKIYNILRYEFKYAMNKYLSTYVKNSAIKNLNDIIILNDLNHEKALRFGQSKLLDAEENTRGDLSEKEYINNLMERERNKKKEIDLFKECSVIIGFKQNLNAQYYGLPSITIPYKKLSNGMPWGISLRGYSDMELLRHARAFEKIIGNRLVPKL